MSDQLTEDDLRRRRLRFCVEQWAECESGLYDPRCCRFPKSCSPHGRIEAVQAGNLTEQDLEPGSGLSAASGRTVRNRITNLVALNDALRELHDVDASIIAVVKQLYDLRPPCPTCDGTKKIACPSCHGKTHPDESIICATCNDFQRIKCPENGNNCDGKVPIERLAERWNALVDPDLDALCEVMHDAYEVAAVTVGWDTQPISRQPWANVPEANKATMRVAVAALLECLRGIR